MSKSLKKGGTQSNLVNKLTSSGFCPNIKEKIGSHHK